MATVARKLTVAEFEHLYGAMEPSYEYWYGEAVRKAMPTWLHSLLQRILAALLKEAGYKSGTELTLRIDPNFHPIPDVVATRGAIEQPYPTKALDIVVEILSPDDAMSRVLFKCRAYAEWGFDGIYIVDPSTPTVFRWAGQTLATVDTFASIPVERIWSALDQELG